MRFVKEVVRVIRGGQTSMYSVAEEHDDGLLLLRPETSFRAVLEQAPEPQGQAVADGQHVADGRPGVVLEVRGLSVAYGAKKAVSDMSFRIGRGEIFGLLGPNGAGKTSTLSAIEGLIKPRSGTVLVDGIDSRSHPGQAKAMMGVQLQSTSFQSELTIRQIVRLYAGLYGVEQRSDGHRRFARDRARGRVE